MGSRANFVQEWCERHQTDSGLMIMKRVKNFKMRLLIRATYDGAIA